MDVSNRMYTSKNFIRYTDYHFSPSVDQRFQMILLQGTNFEKNFFFINLLRSIYEQKRFEDS